MMPEQPGEPKSSDRYRSAEPGRTSARETAAGCLGLFCVLLLPALLFIPTDEAVMPRWASTLVPLVAVALAAVGVWLVAKVPASAPRRSGNPLAPLTSSGRVPVREVPAARTNRAALAVALCLTLVCALGYLLASLAPRSRDVLLGTVLSAVGGALLLVYAVFASRQRFPVPALRWVRMSVRGSLSSQPVPFLLVGGVALAWALIVAFEAGYAWAALAGGLAILAASLLGPLGQRFPGEQRPPRSLPPAEPRR